MLELPPFCIHLYFTFQNEINDRELLDSYQGLLSEEEQRQQQRFYFAKDQHRYLLTRVLTRTTLSKYSSIKPEDWKFTKNAYGRPEIENKDPFEPPLSFNISHTSDMIMLGVAQQTIGLDVENVQIDRASLEIAHRYFSSREVNDLNSLPANQRHEHFFYYWTLKEAYIKARGRGMSLPLRQFSFYFPEPRDIKITFDPRLNEKPEHWRFWLLKPTMNHVAAIGLKHIKELCYRLEIKKIVPLYSDMPFECTVFRQSQVKVA